MLKCGMQSSAELAEHILLYLGHAGLIQDCAVILVANKTDLVRSREVKTASGKRIATKYHVKYIETSPGSVVFAFYSLWGQQNN